MLKAMSLISLAAVFVAAPALAQSNNQMPSNEGNPGALVMANAMHQNDYGLSQDSPMAGHIDPHHLTRAQKAAMLAHGRRMLHDLDRQIAHASSADEHDRLVNQEDRVRDAMDDVSNMPTID